jgi:ABC-type Zn uptake system ZnuABC Zn-binding protein ZnuA
MMRVAALLIVLCAACQPAPAASSVPAGTLKVVVTYSILGDLVQNVGGDRIDLAILVGAGGDTHTYEPTPGDSRALAEAGLVIENGLGLEGWMDDLYISSGSKALRLAASDGIEPLPAADAHRRGVDGRSEFDPHLWHSVANAIQVVKHIRAALAGADAANATVYQANAEVYIAQLTELDGYIRAQIDTVPPERRKLVTNHDALGYFAKAYGFTLLGDALGSVSTEAAEPSAAQIAAVSDSIRREGVPAVFTENIEGSRVIEQIAKEAGVKVAAPLYTDALGPAGSDGATYLQMMRYNVDVIVSALR